MNFRLIAHYLAMVLKVEAAFMAVPLLMALVLREFPSSRGFVLTMALMLLLALFIDMAGRGRRNIYGKDGFVLVAACWIAMSFFGAMPFWISGEISGFSDCFFESVSGFTTTGSSILPNVEALPYSMLFWRSFSQWIGGMGVLVFLVAIVPAAAGERTLHVLRAELPGPAPGKLVPKLRQSSKILYGIYLSLTLVQILLLAAGGMPLFDAVCNAMSTTATGGISPRNASMGAYGSLYLEGVTVVFMLLCAVNFNVHYFLLTRNWKAIWRNDELKTFLAMFALGAVLISANLTLSGTYRGWGQSLRHALFQTSSAVTTTGYATADYTLWPMFSKLVLWFLMFVGACAGSTGGGIKVSRFLILFRETRRILNRMAHPRSVGIVRLDGKAVDKMVVHSVGAYFTTMVLLICGSLLLVSLDNYDFETTFTAVTCSISNIGPGFGLVSPTGNFSEFSTLSKLVLSLDMLLGRLEIYPIVLLLAPKTWRSV